MMIIYHMQLQPSSEACHKVNMTNVIKKDDSLNKSSTVIFWVLVVMIIVIVVVVAVVVMVYHVFTTGDTFTLTFFFNKL